MSSFTRSLSTVALTAGLAIGATYLFDPASGRDRRIKLGSQCASAATKVANRARRTRDRVGNFVKREAAQVGQDVTDAVAAHDDATVVPEVAQRESWSPRTRIVRGVIGGTLLAWGSRHRGTFGALADATGSALILRSATNRSLPRLIRSLKQLRSQEGEPLLH